MQTPQPSPHTPCKLYLLATARLMGHLQVHLSWWGRPSRRPWEAPEAGCGVIRHGFPSPGDSEGRGCVVQTVGGHGLCLVALSCGEGGLRGGAGRPLGSSVQGGHACPGPWWSCTCPHQTGEALLRRSDPAGLQTLS